ncbi:MAG: hypothetical protein HY680_11025 [Chloroflexi bacterium]|nr:hypothetical protein [Chloroflexota bacterium]
MAKLVKASSLVGRVPKERKVRRRVFLEERGSEWVFSWQGKRWSAPNLVSAKSWARSQGITLVVKSRTGKNAEYEPGPEGA